MKLGVNGTLMRELQHNEILIKHGAGFITETTTAPCYRLWSINDEYPGMLRVTSNGQKVILEIWEIPDPEIIEILNTEPKGLTLGTVLLASGEEVFGILAEPYIVQNCREITQYGGWRAYIAKKQP